MALTLRLEIIIRKTRIVGEWWSLEANSMSFFILIFLLFWITSEKVSSVQDALYMGEISSLEYPTTALNLELNRDLRLVERDTWRWINFKTDYEHPLSHTLSPKLFFL